MAQKKKAGIADALLDAHVAFVVAELEGAKLKDRVEAEIDALLAGAAKLKLEEVVSRAAVKEVVRVYASELELGGGIPELIAGIARLLHKAEIHERTRLDDLLSERQFAEILDKLLEMRELRTQLLDEAVDNPAYAALASDLLYHGIKGYLQQSRLTDSIPGARSMMQLGKRVIQRASPGLEHAIEDNLKAYIRKNIGATLKESRRFILSRLDEAKLREAVLEAWTRLKRARVSGFRRYLDADDLEDFFVIGYEWWRVFRKSEWFAEVVNIGVDHFFDTYGKTALSKLLEEVGIGRQHLLADAMRFAPPAIKALKKKKLLEPLVRRNLEGFYRSAEVEKIVSTIGRAR